MIEAPFAKIDWRVQGKPSEREGGWRCLFVPYLDAATVAELLDGWVGSSNWFDAYETTTLAGEPALWCHLSVREKNDEWVTKTDVGVASNMEAQKGMVSDAFKRAATLKWGVGRNVYELPTVWAPCRVTNNNGKQQAWPSNETLPAIKAELQRSGIEVAELGRAHEGDEPETDPTLEGWDSREYAVESHRDLAARMAQLDDATRAALVEWREANGLTGWPLPRARWVALADQVAALFDRDFEPAPAHVPDYSQLTKQLLVAECATRGVETAATDTKAELIERLEADDRRMEAPFTTSAEAES